MREVWESEASAAPLRDMPTPGALQVVRLGDDYAALRAALASAGVPAAALRDIGL